jgi:hypothetical protein
MQWDVRESLLRQRLSAVSDELERLAELDEAMLGKRRERLLNLETERRRIEVALAQLGPSPRAKMG